MYIPYSVFQIIWFSHLQLMSSHLFCSNGRFSFSIFRKNILGRNRIDISYYKIVVSYTKSKIYTKRYLVRWRRETIYCKSWFALTYKWDPEHYLSVIKFHVENGMRFKSNNLKRSMCEFVLKKVRRWYKSKNRNRCIHIYIYKKIE